MNPRHRESASNHLLFADEVAKRVHNVETLDIEYSIVLYRNYSRGIHYLLHAIIIEKIL